MDKNKLILILIGIGTILLFLVSYLGSKSPLDIFGITLGIMILIFGFYSEGRKINVSISYVVAVFGVNIAQWLILIYTFYYNPVYITKMFYYYLIGASLFTIILANQLRKKYLKVPENNEKIKINILKDKTKLILLFTGVIIIIGSLAGFITYYVPIFLYGITLGAMAIIYGFYHEDKKVNVSYKYARTMIFLIILQFFILFYFFHQFSIDDWALAFTLSANITSFFSAQLYRSDLKLSDALKIPYISDLKISNEKMEAIIGIGAIGIFIVIISFLILKST